MSHPFKKTTIHPLLKLAAIVCISLYTFLLFAYVANFALTNTAVAATATTPVTIPLGLKVAVVCTSGVSKAVLTWTNPNEAKDFSVFRNPSLQESAVWTLLATTVPTTYTDSTIKIAGSYSYQVRAISPQGAARYSDIIKIQNVQCPTPTTANYITFNPKLTVACVNAKPTVSLSWTNPNGAKSFSIFRNPNTAETKAWGLLGQATSTAYTDMTPKVGAQYQYQIQAITADPPARYSDVLTTPTISCSTPPLVPTPPVVTPPPPTPTPNPATTTPPSTKKVLKWGAYPGWQVTDVVNFEAQVGKSPNHIAAFTHWENANDFPSYLAPYAKDKGRTLIIFWEASDHKNPTITQPRVSYDSILGGIWDPYIRKFAEQSRAYGGPVILIPFSEANGNWSPWSGSTNGNTPEKAVLGYRHVRNIFGTVPNVKFGFVVNSNSVPDTAANAIEKYYPGSAYVDYVGVDGFNFGNPWMTFDQIFKKPLTLLSTYGKPMYVFSFASAASTEKAAWITNALSVEMYKYPLIEGWSWFNQNKEANWLISSDPASLAAFKNALP